MVIYPKISIVTPSYNQCEFLQATIESVIGQNYPNLEYIIIDGGSNDNSVDIIRKYEKHIHTWISEKDNGLYEALQKGFAISTGEIMGWLNSDDLLHPKSLFSIAEIFSNFNSVQWLQGYPTVIDHSGRILYHRNPRNSKYSFYLKDYVDGVFIQQESTYWKRSLWEKAGGYISADYKYAGDFELWMRFFNYEILYTTTALVGAFRRKGIGQLSVTHYEDYLHECDHIIGLMVKQLNKSDSSLLLKRKLAKYCTGKFYRLLIKERVTPMINYSFDTNQFHLSE